MKKLAIINGPNLNMLGTREPEIYGTQTFEDFLIQLKSEYPGIEFLYFQSNIEGELINQLQAVQNEVAAIIINPGGYSHTSVALGDCIKGISIPVIEVHISNIYKREPYRHQSITGAAAKGVITGLGLNGYRAAIDTLTKYS